MRDRVNRRTSRTTPVPRHPTPRQQRVLELASIGLSDQEIAARLAVSLRTVRFHLERIYRLFDVRSRVEAVLRWRALQDQPRHPADECPYPKPFPDDFSDCPAYQASQTVALDEQVRPSGRIWTCRHLENRIVPETDHRWYGACRLGDAIARRRWAEQVEPERLDAINGLLNELAPLTAAFALNLWKLKGDQLRTLQQDEDPAPLTRAMESRGQRFIGDLERFLTRRRSLLGQDQLDVDENLRLARDLVDRIVASDSAATWDYRFELLVRFPWDIWSVLPTRSHAGAANARR